MGPRLGLGRLRCRCGGRRIARGAVLLRRLLAILLHRLRAILLRRRLRAVWRWRLLRGSRWLLRRWWWWRSRILHAALPHLGSKPRHLHGQRRATASLSVI